MSDLIAKLQRSVTDTTAFCPSPVFRNPDGPAAIEALNHYQRALTEAREALDAQQDIYIRASNARIIIDAALKHARFDAAIRGETK